MTKTTALAWRGGCLCLRGECWRRQGIITILFIVVVGVVVVIIIIRSRFFDKGAELKFGEGAGMARTNDGDLSSG